MNLDKIATDFEKFVHDGNTIASAIGLIGGSKDSPVWVQNGNLQEDNVLAEAAINPCSSLDEFKRSIFALNKELENALPPGYSLVTKPVHRYTPDFLMSAGRNAMVFGCSAELQAWTGEEIVAPSPYTELRTAGAHVHFSYNNPDEQTTREIIMAMDYTLGAWSVLVDPDRSRRELYGTAGSCRIKEYGGEYRVLSNFWVDSEELIEQVYNRTVAAMRADLSAMVSIANGSELRAAIDSYNYRQCSRISTEVDALLGL